MPPLIPACSPVCSPACPIDKLRPDVLATVEQHKGMVLSAPPGTGKSSRIPLWLLQSPYLAGQKILVLEPRRMAARMLGRYMASLLGEAPGQTVGWRVRGESVGKMSRILVVTEGVLTRMLQQDPELSGIGCVIFDEFHERSLEADLGLALCLESQNALRDDLRLILMSATLDVEKTRALLGDCPALTCDAPAWPVDIRWNPVPGLDKSCALPLLRHAAATIRHALHHETGNILVFLPGMGEILAVARLLENSLPAGTFLHIMHGSLPLAQQDRAIAPTEDGERKVVLATTVVESSLTIEGIRIVIDCGFSRSQYHDHSTGINRLVTQRVTLDSATQRTGRAGRTEPGVCYRLWAREEEHGMLQRAKPDILQTDLSGFVLNLADWGIVGAQAVRSLQWTDAPPTEALEKAVTVLCMLGAFDDAGRITPLGRRMARLPASPRISRLLIEGEDRGEIALAACLAAILEAERGAINGDMACQLDWLCRKDGSPEKQRLRQNAKLFARALGFRGDIFTFSTKPDTVGILLACAWPDRLAMRCATTMRQAHVNFLLRTGQAVSLPATHALANQDFLVAPTIVWHAQQGNIVQAAPLCRSDVMELFSHNITTEDRATVADDLAVRMTRRTMLDKIVLGESPRPAADAGQCAAAICAYLKEKGIESLRYLPWSPTTRQWQARVSFLRHLDGEIWPDVGDAALLDTLKTWLAPYLTCPSALKQLSTKQLGQGLASLLTWQQSRLLDSEAPVSWQSPAGVTHPIVYGDDGGPWLAAKLQEFFGCETTPGVANGRVALTLRLLSPAGRPLQITQDLTSFWRNGYAAVRSEMLGRYPRHPWPEDPVHALPTAKSKKQALVHGSR